MMQIYQVKFGISQTMLVDHWLIRASSFSEAAKKAQKKADDMADVYTSPRQIVSLELLGREG